MQSAAPLRIGKYVLHGVLGAGGTATVHYGVLEGHAGFARTVAIKRLYPHFARDEKLVAEFLQEARLVTRIQHPNVVQTLDVVVHGEECLVVMEYVPGETLARLLQVACKKPDPPPSAIVSAIVIDLLRGLHAAHEARDQHRVPLGIVHRDVSPQNVIVGADGFSRILDFGIAKVIGQSSMTPREQMKGKISYMAPEQQRGQRVDLRSDIFAASIVLWESLVGRRLFLDDTEAKTLENTLSMSIEPPSHFAPSISPALDAVVLRGLDRDPEQRHRNAKVMADALTEAMKPATALEVGAWVDELAHDALLQRSEMIRAIESPGTLEISRVHTEPAVALPTAAISAPTSPSTTSSSVAEEQPPTHARSRTAFYVGCAIVIVCLGSLELALRHAEASRASSTPPAPSVAEALTIADSAINTADPSAVPAVASADDTTNDSRAARPPRRSHLRFPKRQSHCSPPFTIDSSGHKVYKPECF